MLNIKLTKGQLINAKNHLISIGTFNTTDVAIISKSSGEFVKFKNIPKKNSPLNKIKLRFKSHLCSEDSLVFQWIGSDQVQQMIDILKNNK